MFSTTADVSPVPRIAHHGYRGIARIALAATVLVSVTQAAVSQTINEQQHSNAPSAAAHIPRWDFLVASGTLVPTGAQRGDIKRANVTAAQLLYVVRPDLAFTTTLAWARSRDTTEHKLDVFSYDLGVESRPAQWVVGNAITLTPFVGVGAGMRSYNTRNSDVDTSHRIAAYVSAGGDVGIRRVHMRLEVRDYVSGSSGQGTGGARNDVVAMLGLYFTGQ
jgi:hypothetical protein